MSGDPRAATVARANAIVLTLLRIWIPRAIEGRCDFCGVREMREAIDIALIEAMQRYDRALSECTPEEMPTVVQFARHIAEAERPTVPELPQDSQDDIPTRPDLPSTVPDWEPGRIIPK